MSKIWFVYSSEVVSGPFTTEQVEAQLSLGQWTNNCFIWWRGQREWIPIDTWQKQLKRILTSENDKAKSPVWYLDVSGSPIGPLTQNEMIENLRRLSNLGKVRLWTVGMNKWTNLFELHDIMDQLGLSRRENERAPLMGSVAIQRLDDTRPLVARAASISVAGLGVNDAQSLKKGEEVNLIIKSSEFNAPLRMKAIVAYATPQGYVGLKFQGVHPESQSVIFDYVRKFSAPAVKKQTA